MKKSLLAGLLLVPIATLAGPDEVGHHYLVPKAGYVFADQERNLDDAWTYGLALGRHLSPNWSVEFNVLLADHDGDAPGAPDVDTRTFTLDGLYVLNRDNNFAPYLTAGLGWLTADANNGVPTNDDFILQAGVGALWRVWQRSDASREINIRPEVKARMDDAGADKLLDYIVTVGFEIGFGAPKRMPEPVRTVVAPPPPPPPPAPPPPPPPADADNDGVLDSVDRCLGTPRGTAVDATGCPRRGSITLVGVTFENNSAKLKPESFAPLDAVAADLKKYPRLKVEVQGHTDSNGADAYNLTLSQSRAESVREYLIGKGVAAAQLSAKGYGETMPVADNKTAPGRAENRRVVMGVLDNPGDVEVKKE